MFVLFAAIGILLLAIGVFVTRRTRQFIAAAETAEGVVLENLWQYSSSRNSSGTYHPRVRFRTQRGNEVEFVSDTGSSPPSYRPNESVEVVYDPENPQRASINSFWNLWLGSIILFGLGVVFTGVGVGPIVWMRKQQQSRQWVRDNGQRIETALEAVELDRSLTVNGSHPYRIVSQWLNPATNQVHVFKSESIWYDPGKYLPGRSIFVWIDPASPKRYSMETDFLPRRAD